MLGAEIKSFACLLYWFMFPCTMTSLTLISFSFLFFFLPESVLFCLLVVGVKDVVATSNTQ